MTDFVVSDPLVSIIIPVYNGSNYMRQAIDSALSQIYRNIEVIVVNDGSNDNNATEDIALSYGDKIRYFSKQNGGVSSALNFGISKMRGKYFSWLSHDDMYCPQKIEHQIEALRKYDFSDAVVALCDSGIMDAQSKIIGASKPRFNDGFVSWQEALYDVLINGAYNGCAFLIPKKVFEDVGTFDESLRYLQDTKMWKMIFSSRINMVYTYDRDVINRVHQMQLTQTGSSLFFKESFLECDMVLPVIVSLSSKEHNFVLAYAKRWAHYGNRALVNRCKVSAKGIIDFTIYDNFSLLCLTLYGLLRPTIRKIYYRHFRKIKVK